LIFQNIEEKIEKYDNCKKGKQYNRAYRKVLRGRNNERSLVNENGNITEQSINLIEDTLKKFDMATWGAMDVNIRGETFRDRLTNKLQRDNISVILRRLRNLQIESGEWQNYKDDIKELYETLSEDGENSLDAYKRFFDVGTTKILNFLFPELFVIVNSKVSKTLIDIS